MDKLTLALNVLRFVAEALTALGVIFGTARNLLSHAEFISTAERGKIGAALDRMSLVAEKGKKGLVWVLSLPGFASREPEPQLKLVQPRDRGDGGFVRSEAIAISFLSVGLMWGMLVLVMALSGCATSLTPSGAKFSEKVRDDIAVVRLVANDISLKCPKLAPIVGLISKAVAVATNPYDLLSDITNAMAAIPDLKQDYDAIKCAVQTVMDDYKKYKPQTPAAAQQAQAKVALLQRLLDLLDEPGAPAMLCASPSE